MTQQLLKTKQTPPAKNGTIASHPGDIIVDGHVRIPSFVKDIHSFRRWAFSDDFPSRGQFSFLDGTLWVDLSMETDDHNQIKTAITITVGFIVKSERLGRFYSDRMLLTHLLAGLANEPDCMFLSNKTLEKKLAVLKKAGDSLEVSGTPDMTLEVVSKTSGDKDFTYLRDRYARAGVIEYWLVDSTSETPELDILRLVSGKYVSVRKHDGWVKSNVFGRSFRLTRSTDDMGLSQYRLETK